METIYVERLRLMPTTTDEGSEWRWVTEVEQVDPQGDFRIDDSNIDFELCRMGQLLARYGSLAAELNTNLARKEEELKYVAARIAAAHRAQSLASGSKTTVDSIKDEVVLSPEYQTTLAPLHILRADAEKVKHWWRSAQAKADALNSLTYWRGAEMRRT